MGKPTGNSGDGSGSSAAGDTAVLSAEAQAELELLRSLTEADSRLLSSLGDVHSSPAAAAAANETRARFEQNLLRSCELLGEGLENAQQLIAELRESNRRLLQENEQLDYRNRKLRLELNKALKISGPDKSGGAAGGEKQQGLPSEQQEKAEVKSAGRRRGAPPGHRGATRKIPQKIDREEIIAPPQFCSCGCDRILPLDDFDSRYVEDIPPVSVQVTHQKFMRGLCSNCGKTVRHSDALSGPPVVTGPNIAAHLTVMNQMGVTFRKLSLFSSSVLGLELSPPGALGIVNRVADSLEAPYGDVLGSLPECDWLNGDETGWKVMGRRGYIWCFCNDRIAFFHHDFSRSAEVIEDILGEQFGGIVICDFYAAYNCIDQTQRCLVHLLRDIRTERELLGSKLLKRFEKALRRFIDRGLKVQAMPDGDAKDRAVAELDRDLHRLTKMNVTKGRAETLVRRIEKYRDDIIRFVTHPGVQFHNNRAERQLRPLVVNRKVSFGSSTEHGARRYCVIHTVVETCRLQQIDPVDFIRRAYVSGGLDVPDLTGAGPPKTA